MWFLSKRLYILFRCFDYSTALFTLLSWKCKSNKNYMETTMKLIRLRKLSFVRGIVKCGTPCGIRLDVNKAREYFSSSKLYVYAGRWNVLLAKEVCMVVTLGSLVYFVTCLTVGSFSDQPNHFEPILSGRFSENSLCIIISIINFIQRMLCNHFLMDFFLPRKTINIISSR